MAGFLSYITTSGGKSLFYPLYGFLILVVLASIGALFLSQDPDQLAYTQTVFLVLGILLLVCGCLILQPLFCFILWTHYLNSQEHDRHALIFYQEIME